MEVRDGVFSYDVERREGNYEGEQLSVHVVETDDAVVQFGSGDAFTVDRVAAITDEHDVDVVVIEHADPDHYGGASTLARDLGVSVAAPEGDADALADQDVDVDHRLRDGERFHGIEPIAAPGHSPGNMAYRYGDVLVAGDTVIGSDFGRAAPHDWSGPLAMLGDDSHADAAQAYRSVRRLLEYDLEVILVTHGSNVTEDADAAVRTLVDDVERVEGRR